MSLFYYNGLPATNQGESVEPSRYGMARVLLPDSGDNTSREPSATGNGFLNCPLPIQIAKRGKLGVPDGTSGNSVKDFVRSYLACDGIVRQLHL